MFKVTAIIPVYNEKSFIENCLDSLKKQTVKCEVIVVDDGSTDGSDKFATFKQNHQGPGSARNLGAGKATGSILVFVDADMEFASDFVEKLIAPIVERKAIGTFSKEEYLLNKDNNWARLWNVNLGRSPQKMHTDNYPDQQHVFRAILKSKFMEVNGFDANVGYTDDWSLARKLGVMAEVAPGAIFYHANPGSLAEVWKQARWFGKNEFLTCNLVRKCFNLFRYFPLWSIFYFYNPRFLVFKLVYNSAVFWSVLLSFFGEQKAK